MEESLYSVALVFTRDLAGKTNITLYSKVVRATSIGDAFLNVYDMAQVSLKEHQLFIKVIHIITPDMYVNAQAPNQ